jgi:peptide/nickel transport system permease protein
MRFLIIRLARSLITLLICVSAVFIVLRLAGDPVAIMLPPETPPDVVEQYRVLWGLDQTLGEQYVRFLLGVVQGEFGKSFADGRSAIEVVAESLPKTFLLGFAALLLALLVGFPLGIVAALRHNSSIDRFVMSFAVLGYSVPIFFLGVLMILLFALKLRVLPSAGSNGSIYLIMPALTLGLPLAGRLARFVRTAMLEVLTKPFIRAAKGKGVRPLGIVFRHALPNAAVTLIMFLGIEIGNILAGTAVTETIFAWPGMGRLLVDAVATRDLPVVQAVILTVTLIMILSNLMVDILHVMIDPRLGGISALKEG